MNRFVSAIIVMTVATSAPAFAQYNRFQQARGGWVDSAGNYFHVSKYGEVVSDSLGFRGKVRNAYSGVGNFAFSTEVAPGRVALCEYDLEFLDNDTQASFRLVGANNAKCPHGIFQRANRDND